MQNLDPSFIAALQYFVPAIMAALAAITMEAQKYIFTPLWNTQVFLKTNILPLGLNIALALVVYFLLVYVPASYPVLEGLSGEVIVISAAGIFGFTQNLIKQALQPKKDINDLDVVEANKL